MRRMVPEKFWSKLAKTVEREKPRFVVICLSARDGLEKREKGDWLLVDASDAAEARGELACMLTSLPSNIDKAFTRRIKAIQGGREGKR